jgi:predicted nucleic acid-binding protein
MTVVLDASALLALHIDGPQRDIVRSMLDSDTTWVACAIALSESIAAASRLTDEAVLARHLEDMMRHTWDFLHIVPIDQSLLDEATTLCQSQPVGVSAALHLAAASRLPAPVHFITFDASQIPVALSLGFEVVSG